MGDLWRVRQVANTGLDDFDACDRAARLPMGAEPDLRPTGMAGDGDGATALRMREHVREPIVDAGEVEGRAGASYASLLQEHPQALKEGKMIAIMQVGPTREKDLPHVPLMHELTEDPEKRQILSLISSPVLVGRPFAAPPETPRDRVDILRRAFDAVMANPEAQAEAMRLNIDLNPITGDQLTRVVKDILEAPPDLLKKAVEAMAPPDSGGAKK